MKSGEKKKQEKLEFRINQDYLNVLVEIANFLNIDSNKRSQNSDSRANALITKILAGETLSINRTASQISKINQHFGKCQTQAEDNFNFAYKEATVSESSVLKKEFQALANKLNGESIESVKISFRKIMEENRKSISEIINNSKKFERIDSEEFESLKSKLIDTDIHENLPQKRNLAFRIESDKYQTFFKKQVNLKDPYNRRSLKNAIDNKIEIYATGISKNILDRLNLIINEYEEINKARNSKRITSGNNLGISAYFTEIYKIRTKIKELEKEVRNGIL